MKKIINNKQYLQVKDIIYLLRNDSCFPMDIYYSFVNKYGITINENEYIEIENKYKNYINKSNLLSYEILK